MGKRRSKLTRDRRVGGGKGPIVTDVSSSTPDSVAPEPAPEPAMRTRTRWNDESDDETATVTKEAIPAPRPLAAATTTATEDPTAADTEVSAVGVAEVLGSASAVGDSQDALSVLGILHRVGILDPAVATASLQALCDAFLERSRDDIMELLAGKGATQMEITTVLLASKGERGRMGVPDSTRWGDEGWVPKSMMKDKAATAPEAFVTEPTTASPHKKTCARSTPIPQPPILNPHP